MRLLLDTHAFLWWDAGRLSKGLVNVIQRADEVYGSAVSAWEVAIKSALGKIEARGSVAEAIDDYGFSPLPITVDHADAVASLPPHHRDPFDRLLAVQARVEGLTLVTRDRSFRAYEVKTLWA